jgi:hypothetical protein
MFRRRSGVKAECLNDPDCEAKGSGWSSYYGENIYIASTPQAKRCEIACKCASFTMLRFCGKPGRQAAKALVRIHCGP